MRTYFALAVTFIATAVLLVVVFPDLPVDGELLDLKPGYSYDKAMASIARYGPEGRTAYA